MKKLIIVFLLISTSLSWLAFTPHTRSSLQQAGLKSLLIHLADNWNTIWDPKEVVEEGAAGWEEIAEVGISGRYYIAKRILSKQIVENLVGVPVFHSGPHRIGLALSEYSDFGYYNPAFITQLHQMMAEILQDKEFVKRFQPLYDQELQGILRNFYDLYQAGTNPENGKKDFWELAKSGMPSPNFDLAMERNTCIKFWSRRKQDGTAVKFQQLLTLMIQTFDPAFLSIQTPDTPPLISGIFSIESAAFPNSYLRMDPTGVPARGGKSGGIVNVQTHTGSLEKFQISPLGDGLYSIELVSHPGYYLRMAAHGITGTGSKGGGTVNVQNRVGSLEKFRITSVAPGVFSIESAASPGHFLRMSNQGVWPEGSQGGGTVNVQNYVGNLERFHLVKQQALPGLFCIASTYMPNRYLRMDATHVPYSGGDGGGIVNVQNRLTPTEIFRFNYLQDGTYSISAAATHNRYLRMNAHGVPNMGGAGGGQVNVQNRVGSLEKFHLILIGGDTYSIESAATPNRYLRMNVVPVSDSDKNGGGEVNVQNKMWPFERFRLIKQAEIPEDPLKSKVSEEVPPVAKAEERKEPISDKWLVILSGFDTYEKANKQQYRYEFGTHLLNSTLYSNLNPGWYINCIPFDTKAAAQKQLAALKKMGYDSYIKFSGSHQPAERIGCGH